jgi:hypothetical protein
MSLINLAELISWSLMISGYQVPKEIPAEWVASVYSVATLRGGPLFVILI